jgi:hypothetical protein
LVPLTEEEFKEIKAEQDAQKRGHIGGGTPQTLPQHEAPPPHEDNYEIWPKVTHRVIEDKKLPEETPKQSFVWPRVSNSELKVKDKVSEDNKPQEEMPKQSFVSPRVSNSGSNYNSTSEKSSAASLDSVILPGEKTPRKSGNGMILFQSNLKLEEAENLLYNEGYNITRITAPSDPPSGCKVALRFPWSQSEAIKAMLEKAGVQTQGIKQL